jgi:hypothetical protein
VLCVSATVVVMGRGRFFLQEAIMKWQSKLAAASIFAMTVAAGTLGAAPASWTGQISDAMCKGVHGTDAKTCVQKCMKDKDAKYVLVVKDKDASKVYAISNQTFADLAKHAGETVVVTGDMDAKTDTITVTKVALPKPSK